MKMNLKNICICSLTMIAGAGFTACSEFLDREPLTSVTPDAYFTTDDQVGAYVITYYTSHLVDSRGNSLYHPASWAVNMNDNDDNTDNFLAGQTGSTTYFNGQWESGTGQAMSTDYTRIRVWNYLINTVESKRASITGSNTDHYLGEAYFFRALCYFNTLSRFGDIPYITEVLPDDASVLMANAGRTPRNEVARHILEDLDRAASMLYTRAQSPWGQERINRECAYLLKSRVALFEATFERYHQGSGRVPGDSNWPGKDKSYNAGKTFDISGEIDFFLGEAMSAAKAAITLLPTLTENSHVFNPEYAQIYGWNPYFEMFSPQTPDASNEVLLYRTYNASQSTTHNAVRRLIAGNLDGVTRSFVTDFLTLNGLPIYADPDYEGDRTISTEKRNRDERLQLFVFGEEDVNQSDTNNPTVKETEAVVLFEQPMITTQSAQNLDVTGYRPRKYLAYDYSQATGDDLLSKNACPVFRISEAYLNYIEACYEKTQTLDADAKSYWTAIRKRAGITADYTVTDAQTDLNKELTEYQHLAAYGINDVTLYNIRRERRCELIGEGFRWDDLKRWRSWDYIIPSVGGKKYIVEGFNLWDEMYTRYPQSAEEEKSDKFANKGLYYLIADGTSEANVSRKEDGVYLRPLRRSATNNDLYEGYTWRKAYYLMPLGSQELQLVATDPTDYGTSMLYQNPYWGNTAGVALE